ncbi:Cu(I)-responsive transcriptional regulator [Roseateles sp.]|uniref:Cu(I)-responsive transcriptional regulator n=1 Tax=Roseateles sp. TaxID=1971397 RepID=UPI00286B0759|nr:Cu(I)-responsive transcriptional regulator [Roseateles sp.]
MLNIGQAAALSGVSAKMIRHYEAVGLLTAAVRTEAGYRQYAGTDVQTLRFIRHSRDLGFSIVEIAKLLSLWRDRSRPSREVKALAKTHIQALEVKAQELLAMKAALEHLVDCCLGDERPECPIIESLAGEKALVALVAPPSSTAARSHTTGLRTRRPAVARA